MFSTSFLILGLGVLVGVFAWRHLRAGSCPACRKRKLECVQFFRATVISDGRRAPDSLGFFRCLACGGRFKKGHGHSYVEISNDEWIA